MGKLGRREWLSGRASPCQGEGREFDPRLSLKLNRQGACFLITQLFFNGMV